jgi:hypothetical protein
MFSFADGWREQHPGSAGENSEPCGGWPGSLAHIYCDRHLLRQPGSMTKRNPIGSNTATEPSRRLRQAL